jgi:phage tail-like protein
MFTSQLFTWIGGPMAQNSELPQSFDPYKNFRFRLKWDGQSIAGVSRCTIIEQRGGGDPSTSHKTPGRGKYEPITLERGVTYDPGFQTWAGLAWNQGAGAQVPPERVPRDITLEIFNEAGELAVAYTIYRCRVSEFEGMPDLDAGANAVAIEHIKLENEGWEADTSSAEFTEPTLGRPQ